MMNISLKLENGDNYELGKQIKFDLKNLYMVKKYANSGYVGGEIYRYTSPDSRILIAGGNGDGTALNQIRGDASFMFEFDNNEEFLYIKDGQTFYNQDAFDPVRILKWRIGNSSGNLVAQMVKNDMDREREESLSGYSNLVVDNNDNLYFSSSHNIYRIKSQTTQIEKVISHQDIWSSDYDRIFSNGWNWHTQGLNIRGNILSTGAQYRFQSTRYYVLNWDISDSFKPTGYEVSKERGLKLSSNGKINLNWN